MSPAGLSERPATPALNALLHDPQLAGTALHLGAGKLLFSPDRPPKRVYLIASGLIRLMEPPNGGQRLGRTLAWVGPGQIVGWQALASGSPDRLCARAERDSRLIPLPTRWLARRISRFPRLGLEMIAQLTSQLRATRIEAGELIQLEAPQRLARALCRLVKHPALAQPNGRWAVIRLTHADLASRTGISRETVSLILSRWRRMGVVRTSRGRLAVLLDRLSDLPTGQ